MRDTTTLIAAIGFALLLFTGIVWWKYSVWTECRHDRSVMYCLSLISK